MTIHLSWKLKLFCWRTKKFKSQIVQKRYKNVGILVKIHCSLQKNPFYHDQSKPTIYTFILSILNEFRWYLHLYNRNDLIVSTKIYMQIIQIFFHFQRPCTNVSMSILYNSKPSSLNLIKSFFIIYKYYSIKTCNSNRKSLWWPQA